MLIHNFLIINMFIFKTLKIAHFYSSIIELIIFEYY
jgi:hypothetical protein